MFCCPYRWCLASLAISINSKQVFTLISFKFQENRTWSFWLKKQYWYFLKKKTEMMILLLLFVTNKFSDHYKCCHLSVKIQGYFNNLENTIISRAISSIIHYVCFLALAIMSFHPYQYFLTLIASIRKCSNFSLFIKKSKGLLGIYSFLYWDIYSCKLLVKFFKFCFSPIHEVFNIPQ